jgi:ABC-type sugar transport system ATPase subunit
MKKKITAMLLAICCISSTWTVYADDFSSGSSEVEIEITEDEDADVDDVEITEDADANDEMFSDGTESSTSGGDISAMANQIVARAEIQAQEYQQLKKEAKKYAEQFQIEYLLKKNSYELSGGEKQRVAICRALINNPDLILADEPTGNLDSNTSLQVIKTLVHINETLNKTVVMVTHDPKMASYGKKTFFLKDGVILDSLIKKESNEKYYEKILNKMVQI